MESPWTMGHRTRHYRTIKVTRTISHKVMTWQVGKEKEKWGSNCNTIQAQEIHAFDLEQIYIASVIPTHSPAELRESKHHCITLLTNQTWPSLLFNHDLREIRHITTSALHFQNLLWRKSINITNKSITESYSWIRRRTLQGRPDQAYLEPAYQVTYQYRRNKWMVYQVRNLWMTRRDLTEEETNSIPVYLEAPFFSIKDNCILT